MVVLEANVLFLEFLDRVGDFLGFLGFFLFAEKFEFIGWPAIAFASEDLEREEAVFHLVNRIYFPEFETEAVVRSAFSVFESGNQIDSQPDGINVIGNSFIGFLVERFNEPFIIAEKFRSVVFERSGFHEFFQQSFHMIDVCHVFLPKVQSFSTKKVTKCSV